MCTYSACVSLPHLCHPQKPCFQTIQIFSCEMWTEPCDLCFDIGELLITSVISRKGSSWGLGREPKRRMNPKERGLLPCQRARRKLDEGQSGHGNCPELIRGASWVGVSIPEDTKAMFQRRGPRTGESPPMETKRNVLILTPSSCSLYWAPPRKNSCHCANYYSIWLVTGREIGRTEKHLDRLVSKTV